MAQPTPPITEQMREHAKENPNSWLYIADPGYAEQDGDVPPEGIVGAFHIDANGEIDEDFQANDKYVPSEMAANPLEPTNELERVLIEIAAGQRGEGDLPAAVLRAEILLYAPAEDDRMVYSAEMSDGTRLVPGCTSEHRVPQDWPGFRRVPGTWLPDVLSGLDLGLNLHEAIQAVIPNAVLLQAVGRSEQS